MQYHKSQTWDATLFFIVVTHNRKILCSGMVMALVSVFIIPCLNAWHKEHKLKKALKKDPGIAETGIMV